MTCVGCAGASSSRPTPPDDVGYPTHLPAPSSIAGDWVLEQRVGVTHREGENHFPVVVQKQGNELLLLVLGPAGRPGLTVRQRGDEVDVDQRAPVSLPFPARYMIHDVSRVWMRPAIPGPGERLVREAHGERITETWSDGELHSRRFERVDGVPAGAITVRYADPGLGPDALSVPGRPIPARVVLDNGWFGYTLAIETTRYTPISSDR